MDSGSKQRFSSLKVFKLPGGGSKPPPVPPKDSFATYRSFQASASSTSLAGAASTDNLHAQSHPGYGPPDSPATGASYAQQSLSVPTYSSSAAYSPAHYAPAPAGHLHSPHDESPRGRENGGFRKSIMKLTSLSRKPFIRQASNTSAMSALREEVPQHDPDHQHDGLPPPPKEDPNISRPWGFEHHVHVTEDFSGIPQSWAESLAAQGLSDAEILQMHQRRLLQQQQQQQQQNGSNPSSPAGSLNGRPPFRPPERQGSLPITDDAQSQSLHGHGHGSGSGSHHYSPVLSHPGLPAANGYSNSRPASPARRIGTPQPAPIRTSPMHVQSDSTGSANIVSPPPSYSAGVGMNGFQPQPAPSDSRHQNVRTSPPDRPIPQPPQRQASPSPVHEQQTSGESAVIDVTGLLGSDDEEDQPAASRRDGDEGSDEDDRSEEEPEEEDGEEDEEDEDGASGDAVGAMPSFKLPALPPRLSIHQDGGLGDFDFTDALFSSLAPDTLLSLSSDPQPQTRTKPPVIVERPPSMLPESPGLFSAMSGSNSPGLPSAGLSSVASTPGAQHTTNNSSLSPLMTNVSASTPPANSALSTAAFSLGDFPMPPPLAEPKVGSPLSPIARSRSPFASGSSASSTRAGTPPVRSTPTPPVQIAVTPRSPADLSDHSPSPVLSEPPSPAPPIKDATIAVVSVAKRAVATEVRSPSSGRNSPANPSPPPRVGSPASGRNSPATGLPPRVAALSNASSSSRPASPANAVPARVAALSNTSYTARPATADSPGRQSPITVSSSSSSSRPSTAPTPAPQPARALSPTMGHRPPPLKLGVDVSDERLQAKVQRSPDPRDFANGRSPAKSPATAILSQLVSTHLPPSPTSARPSAVSPQHGRTDSASSVKRKPVPQIPLPQPPARPPQPPQQQQQQHSRQKSTVDSPTALDDWLSGETDDPEEDEESPARGGKEDDNDMVSAESVLDSWLNEDGDDSATTPGESPQHYARTKPLPPPAHPPPTGPPPAPPAPRDPVPAAPLRSDVPMLRVDTAASTSRPSDATPMQQHQQLNSQASALPTALPVAPPAPWLQGSPASEKKPIYLPAELEPLRELIHLNTDAREMFGELVLVAQGQYGDVYAANQGGPPCALKIAPLYIAAPLTPASAASKASTPGVFDEFGHLRAVKVSPKMAMLKHELVYIGRMRHEHVLGMDALYFVEDSLWIRMELMVRSLADLVGLCGELGDSDEEFGLEEPEVARFAADTLEALKYLESMGIAHRDVRSDNLLLNNQGVVKLADFSHAVKKTEGEPIVCRDIVGVAYWRAAEINSGPYDPMRVDVWSLGATVWELMESEPPFERTKQLATRWPPLQRAQNPSSALQDFLRRCSDPPASRPPAAQLLQTPWIKSACRRVRIVELLERARQIEEGLSLDAEDDEDL
ncbi:hypothetical protein AURDEDRAFT_92792 [Auricularia subglabra TFB-10046 SS5]|nr:hypothetical protein AURDEDRAFT_92792 [Auricularia subglabra TFB-10046 SS5]